jgi:hypothetical protein
MRLRLWLVLTLSSALLLGPGWIPPAAANNEGEKPVTAPPAKEPGQPEEKKEGQEDGCPSTFGPIITDTAIPIDKGKFALQPTLGLSFVTDAFSRAWQRESAGGNFQSLGLSLKFTYGLFNNLEVYTVIPYVQNWASGVHPPGPQGERSADFGGLGDISLTCKYRLVEETPAAPTVSALFTTTFPSGHFRHLNPGRLGTDAIGSGSYAFTTGFNVSKYLKPFIFYGNFWYTFQTDISTEGTDGLGNPIERRIHPRDYVTVNLAAEYPMTKKWVALLELTSNWDAGRLVGAKGNTAPTALVSLLPGLEYMATDKFSLAAGVNINLAGKNTNANITPLLSMVYAF